MTIDSIVPQKCVYINTKVQSLGDTRIKTVCSQHMLYMYVHIDHSLTALKCSNRIQLLSMHADMNGANLSCNIIGSVVPCQYQSVPITYMHMYKGIIYFTLYNIQSIVYSQRMIMLSLRPYYHIWNCLYNNYYNTLHVSVVQPIPCCMA